MSDSKPDKLDRRIQRTHQLLFDALIELVVEKGYEKITVQDITERANVARTTFYLHFRDKEELLINSLKALFDELLQQVPVRSIKEDWGIDVSMYDPDNASDFEHIAKYSEFYRIMFGAQGSAAFVQNFRNYLSKIVKEKIIPQMLVPNASPNLPIDLITIATVNAQIGMYIWWLENKLQPPPKVMAEWSSKLMSMGIFWALGMEIDQSMMDE